MSRASCSRWLLQILGLRLSLYRDILAGQEKKGIKIFLNESGKELLEIW